MLFDYQPYYDVARRFGWTIEPKDAPGLFTRKIRAAGMIEGRPLSVVRTIGDGASVTIEAPFDPPLDLGLSVTPSGLVASVHELFGAVDVEVGDAAFDAAYAIRADEPARATALLSSGVTVELMRLGRALELRDGGLTARAAVHALPDIARDAGMLGEWMLMVARGANVIDRARWTIPPAAEIAPLLEPWRELCRARGLTLACGAPTIMRGRLGTTEIWVRSYREEKRHDLEIGVAFEAPLGFSLDVVNARGGLAALFDSGIDTVVGDAAFDAAFRVSTSDKARAVAVLDAETRARMLDLAKGRRLTLHGRGLTVSDRATDFAPHDVPALVEQMAEVVTALSKNARLGATQGYR